MKSGNVWSTPSLHTSTSTLAPSEIWIRRKGEEDYHLLTVSSSNHGSVSFPADTTAFRFRHESGFYLTRVRINAGMILNPTQKMAGLIRDDVAAGTSSIIKNAARCIVTNEDGRTYFNATNREPGDSSAYNEEYELIPSRTELRVSKESDDTDDIVFDAVKGTQDNTVTITALNYNDSYRLKRLTNGEFYDLLPPGTMVDETTVTGTWRGLDTNLRTISGTLPPSSYDVSFRNNWMDSGRTMMVIRVSVSESLRANRFSFRYMLRNTYENVVENGTVIENDLSFVNTSAKRSPYSSISSPQSV